jgi:hypothetical protein
VTLIALASIKGSPGVTTAATALAASWPERRQVLLVEADPFGGDLAPRYAMAPSGGLSSLFAAARRTLAPEDVWDHVDHLPGGLPVLFGLGGMHQAVANEKAWPIIADALSALDADVVIDVGRLLPNLGGGVRDMLARADALVVLCQSTLESIVHLREALPALAAELRGRSLFVVPTGAAQFSAADIGRTLAVEVLPPMPDDPGAAAALANRRAVKRLERTRLLRWAGDTVQALGVDPISPVTADPLSVPEALTRADPADVAPPGGAAPTDVPTQAGPVDIHQPVIRQPSIHQPTETLDHPMPEGQLAGAGFGSTQEASR